MSDLLWPPSSHKHNYHYCIDCVFNCELCWTRFLTDRKLSKFFTTYSLLSPIFWKIASSQPLLLFPNKLSKISSILSDVALECCSICFEWSRFQVFHLHCSPVALMSLICRVCDFPKRTRSIAFDESFVLNHCTSREAENIFVYIWKEVIDSTINHRDWFHIFSI